MRLVRTRTLLAGGLATALAAASLLIVAVAPAGATPIAVTSAADTGAGTLRQAFADAIAANADTEIDIPASLSPITLTTGALSYNGGAAGTHTLTLVGTGGNVTVTQTTAVRVITDTSTGLLTVDHLTISGGGVTGDGGGISAVGAVTATDSTVSGNTASGNGGGISATGVVTVTNSTVSGNTATGNGGGISGAGAVKVINSTISGNTATANGGGISAAGAVTLVYATVVSNTAAAGANVFGTGAGPPALLTFGSVVALHLGVGANCSGLTTTSSGYNYSDDGSCTFTGTGDSQSASDPLLGPLADNGGPTKTRLPQATSPLVGAIPNATCGGGNALAGAAITTDQRGVPRPQLTGCDIGAVEVALATLNVAKVVSGTSTSAFSEQVNCVASSVTTVANVVLAFNADGTPDPTTTSAGWVVSGSTWQLAANALTGSTCTVTETVTGGATSVSYGCAWTVGAPDASTTVGCPGASSAASATPATVAFDGLGDSGTVTVTNTFDAVPAPAPAAAATPVAPAPAAATAAAVAPKFTG